jgi:hypothetical protein
MTTAIDQPFLQMSDEPTTQTPTSDASMGCDSQGSDSDGAAHPLQIEDKAGTLCIVALGRRGAPDVPGASVDEQLRLCRDYARRQKWPAPSEYVDNEIKHPKCLDLCVLALLAAETNVLLIHGRAIFSRASKHVLRVIRELDDVGVRIIDVGDGAGTAPGSHDADDDCSVGSPS